MNEQFLLYLWCISKSVCGLLNFIGVITVIGFIIVGIVILAFYFENDWEEHRIKCIKLIEKCILSFCLSLCCFLTSALIPSKNDLALIWAYPILKQNIMQKDVKTIPSKILDVSNLYLDKIKKDLEQTNNINGKR